MATPTTSRNKRDLTASARAHARKNALDKIGPDKRIVFAPPAPLAPKHTVTVFTDVDCPFCRRFHQQIAEYNAKGIAVDYLFYPLSIHPGADKKAEAVWCSQDRPNAFTAAMAGKDPGKATCPNPVGELTELAKKLGIGGTPTVLADDGTQISSQIAMSPDRLAAELDRLADKNAAAELSDIHPKNRANENPLLPSARPRRRRRVRAGRRQTRGRRRARRDKAARAAGARSTPSKPRRCRATARSSSAPRWSMSATTASTCCRARCTTRSASAI